MNFSSLSLLIEKERAGKTGCDYKIYKYVPIDI